MALPFQKVQPGDLITAEMMNSIVDELNSLEQRLGALEDVGVGSGKVIITDIPLSPPPRVNQNLDIFGQNFGFTIGAQQVIFDNNVPIGAFIAGSNDSRLIVKVPAIPNIPPAGRPVLIEVRNLTSSDTRTVHILPVIQIQEGPVDVNFISVDPTTIQPNAQPATFKYHLKSRAALLADFLVTPEITGMTNNATVQSQLQVLGPNQVNIPNKQISLAPNEEKDIFIRIPSVPTASANVNFKLKVTVAAGGAGGIDGPRDFTVGQIVILPDTSIVFSFLEPKLVLSPAGGSLDKTTTPFTIRLVTPTAQTASFARISIQGALHFPDIYNASSTILTGTNWNTSVNTQLVPNPLTLADTDFPQGTTEVTKEFRFMVNPAVGASNTASVELKLKRNGSPLSQTMRLNLALI